MISLLKRAVSFGLAMALVGGGLLLSVGFEPAQLYLFGAGLIGLVGIATESFLGQPSDQDPAAQYQLFVLWIAPGLLVAAGLWLAQVMPVDSQVTLAVAMAALAGVLLVALWASIDPIGRFHRPGRFASNLLVYLLVFLICALIYHTKERSLFTATSVAVVAFLAGVEVLRSGQGRQATGWPMAALVALIVAETTWALNYWPISGLIGGAVLLLTFYVFAGLLLLGREGGLDRRVVAEYSSVGLVGLIAIAWAMM